MLNCSPPHHNVLHNHTSSCAATFYATPRNVHYPNGDTDAIAYMCVNAIHTEACMEVKPALYGDAKQQ